MRKRPFEINVPNWAIEEFWKEPPQNTREFWAFRNEPTCETGETIYFYYNHKLIAKAVVDEIQRPGISTCEATGRFYYLWKVFCKQHTFIDMRNYQQSLFA